MSRILRPHCARLGCSWWVQQFCVPNSIRTMCVAQRWARRQRNSRMDIWICSITQLGPPSFSPSLIVIPLATKTPRHQKPCRIVIWSDAEGVTAVLNSRRIKWMLCPMKLRRCVGIFCPAKTKCSLFVFFPVVNKSSDTLCFTIPKKCTVRACQVTD